LEAENMAKERLHKILAACGVDSRRNCEQLIIEGLVKVNGRIVDTLPAFADPTNDVITVQGRKINPQNKVYYLLNKPKGVLCANNNSTGRTRAVDLVPPAGRILCIGRVDADTAGAVILTNDTVLVARLTSPRSRLTKTYTVGMKGKFTAEAAEQLKKGVWFADGKIMSDKITILKAHNTESLIELKITQGLSRQIRDAMSRLGYKVTALTQTHIGKISTYRLGAGKYRPLTKPEIEHLKKI
jgi:23S rRNA pseudouridine2605 synthase